MGSLGYQFSATFLVLQIYLIIAWLSNNGKLLAASSTIAGTYFIGFILANSGDFYSFFIIYVLIILCGTLFILQRMIIALHGYDWKSTYNLKAILFAFLE